MPKRNMEIENHYQLFNSNRPFGDLIKPMKKSKEDIQYQNLLEHIENVSGQIQLLALNIAVSAAKVAQRRSLGLEVNDRLSQLVNQATNTVKKMNELLDVAKSEAKTDNLNSGKEGKSVNRDHFQELEKSVSAIIKDSEKVVNLLNDFNRKDNSV